MSGLPPRFRLAIAGSAVILVIGVIVASQSGGPRLSILPGTGEHIPSGDPFAYRSGRQASFAARATSGSAYVVFAKSPGGVVATAARVARLRSEIARACAGSSVDPNMLEAIVFLESAGRPNALAGVDPAAAAGLTQILAQTGQSLLGMHIDLNRSRALTRAIDAAAANGSSGLVGHLQRERAQIDDRFNPPKAFAATVRYLELARSRFHRSDLAIVSYHMGIGNLQNVLDDYDAGQPAPYVQLYFDTAPDRHTAAFNRLHSFGDDSSLYFWRVLAAAEIMHLYRTDRPALARLTKLETSHASDEAVLHPPNRGEVFANPSALAAAYAERGLLGLPRATGVAYDPGIGELAGRLGVSAALYRGLRPAAIDMLIELAARVRMLSGAKAPLTVVGAVSDQRYEHLLGSSGYSLNTTGYAFDLARRYASQAQAVALQAMLDRLQALNLIAWQRNADTIHVTVASDASSAITNGP